MSNATLSKSKLSKAVFRDGMSPQTWFKSPQRIKVLSYTWGENTPKTFRRIGLVSSFTPPTDSRKVTMIHGIGYGDQVAGSAPGVSDDYSLKLERTELWTLGLMQELGYRGGVDGLVRALKYHRYPMDIKQEEILPFIAQDIQGFDSSSVGLDTYSGDSGDHSYSDEGKGLPIAQITLYETCWITDYSYDVKYDSGTVVENASVSVQDIIAPTNATIPIEYDTGNSTLTGLGSFLSLTPQL